MLLLRWLPRKIPERHFDYCRELADGLLQRREQRRVPRLALRADHPPRAGYAIRHRQRREKRQDIRSRFFELSLVQDKRSPGLGVMDRERVS